MAQYCGWNTRLLKYIYAMAFKIYKTLAFWQVDDFVRTKLSL